MNKKILFYLLLLSVLSCSAYWKDDASLEVRNCPVCSNPMRRLSWVRDSSDPYIAFDDSVHVTKHYSCSSCYVFQYISPCNSAGSFNCSTCNFELCFVCDSNHNCNSSSSKTCSKCNNSYSITHHCVTYLCKKCGYSKLIYSSDKGSIPEDCSDDEMAVDEEYQRINNEHQLNCGSTPKTCEKCQKTYTTSHYCSTYICKVCGFTSSVQSSDLGTQQDTDFVTSEIAKIKLNHESGCSGDITCPTCKTVYNSKHFHKCGFIVCGECVEDGTISVTSDKSQEEADQLYQVAYINSQVDHGLNCSSTTKKRGSNGHTYVKIGNVWYDTDSKESSGQYTAYLEEPAGDYITPGNPDPDNPDNPDPDNPDNPDPENPDNPDPENPDNPDPDNPDPDNPDPDNPTPDNPTPSTKPDDVEPSPTVPDLPGGGKDYTGVLQSIDQELKKFHKNMQVTKTPVFTEKDFSDLPEGDRFPKFYSILQERLIIDFDFLKKSGSSNLNLVFNLGLADVYEITVNLDSLKDPTSKLSTFQGIIRSLLGFVFLLCFLFAVILSLRQW